MYTNVEIVGRLTRDPELKQVGSNGNDVVNFSLAVNRDFGKDSGEVDFFDCTAWNKVAVSLAGNKKKGDLILVRGKLRTSSYESEGKQIKKVNVVASEVVFLPSASASSSSSSSPTPSSSDPIPF